MSAPTRASYLSSRWRLVGFLTLGAALNYADRAALSAVLPALRTDLGLSDVSLGLLGSAFLWAYALGSPLAGNIADHWSRHRIVVVSLVAWSTVTALMGAAFGFGMLLSLRVGLGIAECFFLPAAFALIARHHAVETRGRAMSLISIGINGGMVLGGSAAGYLAEHFGWRTGFTVFGLAGIAAAFLAPYAMPAEDPVNTAPKPKGVSLLEALRYLARVRTYHALLVESILSGMGMWIFYSWLPLYFRDTFNLSLAASGFAGTFMLQISVLLGISVGGWLSDRLARRGPERRLLAYGTCYVIAAPFLLLFVGTPGFAVVVFSISAFSFFRGVGQTNDNPTLCEIVPEQLRSTAVGLMNACSTGAGGCGVLLAGYLKGGFGLNAVFAGISGAFILAAVVLLLAYRFSVRGDIARARAMETA
jgi:predicted MFS family arabinose efflux permease